MRRSAKTRTLFLAVVGVGAVVASPALTHAQTTINGNVMALQSSGAAAGNAWTLSSDGYVGTYITLSQPGTVSFTASATGAASNGLNPDLSFSIADSTQTFTVTPGSSNNYAFSTPTLPAGTYFVRTQLDDQTGTQSPTLTINSLTVAGSNVSVLNSNSSTNATNAATTYATNFRAGPGTIALTNANGVHLGAGTSVQVKLISNAFNFAAAVYGNSVNAGDDQWINVGPTGANLPPTTSEQINYQNAILQNFNMIVPSNAGKWQNNDFNLNSPDMRLPDAETQFAIQNGLRVRMHNLIWNTQQPTAINNLFSTTGTLTAANKNTLNAAITSRINYYDDSNNVGLGTPRADSYTEIDVLNEAWHGQSARDNYIGANALGVSGVANVYAQMAAAVAAAGSNARLYTNEYNVLQFSDSLNSAGGNVAPDPYANWYLNDVQQLQRAGGPVSGIGMELYVTTTNAISPIQMQEAMQNLSVAKDPNGNPIDLTLSEFGVGTGQSPTAATYDADLTTALTMAYGTPQDTTFGYWGGVGGPHSGTNNIYALYDQNYNLTSAGTTWQAWMNQYNTNLTLTTDANGNINFNGTYGLYDVIVGGQTYQLNLVKGSTNYGLMTPIGSITWNGNGANNNFSTATNWAPSLAPNAPLFFAGTNNLTPNNDSTANTEYAGLTFNAAAGAFVIGGNAINLAGDVTNNSASAQTINVPLALQRDTAFNAASGDLSVGGNITGSFALNKTGSHALTLSGANSYTGTTTVTAGTLILAAAGALPANAVVAVNGTSTLQVASGAGLQSISSLTIAPTAKLDVTNNAIAFNFTSPATDPTAALVTELATAYNSGTWTGNGITSTLAAANPGQFALGYANGNTDTGSSAAANQVLIEFTLAGDANLNGTVDFTDLVSLAQNFGFSEKDWSQGNFTYDPSGSVGFADLVLVAQNFGFSTPIASGAGGALSLSPAWQQGLSTAVAPEPAALAALLPIGALLARRRRQARAST